MEHILTAHFSKYPQMTPQDAVKLIYQSSFGGGHLITDTTAALSYLRAERAAVTAAPLPLCEDIGRGMTRLSLQAEQCASIDDTMLIRIFSASAKRVLSRKDNRQRMEDGLSVLTQLTAQRKAPFSEEELSAYLEEYRAAGYPIVRHSEIYRQAYAPTYRVMESVFPMLLPLISAIDHLLAVNSSPVCIAIDGNAAAGKTTAAEALASLYDCNVFHMDDFFLPFHMRTPQRLAEPGGNVHYERFHDEVISGILSQKSFSYVPYSCNEGAYLPPITVKPKHLSIIEGSYAHHPRLQHAYDLRAAMQIDPEEQKKRILRRNGEELLQMFLTRWIPLESTYFHTYRIFSEADILINPKSLQNNG